jgi:hypothetical protein
MIKLATSALLLIILSGCTGFAVYQGSYNFFKDNVIPNKRNIITRDFFEKQKYSFAMVTIGNAAEIVMVLQSVNDGEYKWVSSDGAIFITSRNGRILRTSGIINDVNFALINNTKTSQGYIIDFYNPELLKIKGFDEIKQQKTINHQFLIDEEIEVMETNFVISIPLLRWSEEGFLLEKDGLAIASDQKIHPHFPRIRMFFYLKYN